MRRKSFPARSRVRSSRRPHGPSSLSVSRLADANEEIGSRGTEKLITHSDLQCNSGYTDVDIVPNSLEEEHLSQRKSHCLGTSETGRGFKPLSLDACIICETEDESVSRCSGVDCLVSFHWKCLNAELGSEDPENSLCPYCLFNNLAHRSKSFAEKVVAAEKEIFKHLDKEVKSSDKEVNETSPETQENTTLSDDEHSVGITFILSDQELQRLKDACASKEKQVQVDKDSDNARGKNKETNQSKQKKGEFEIDANKSGDLVAVYGIEASENEARIDTDNFEDAEDDETVKDKTKDNADTERKRDDSQFVSTQETLSGKEQDGVQQIGKRRRWLSEISSNGSTNDHNEDATEHKISSSAHVTTSSVQKGKDITTTEVDKGKTVRDSWILKKDMRRKLYWTAEEEEMLKLGVEIYSAEAKKNMPWRKILEMGKKVFHETRTPADLKDKWRRLSGATFQSNSSKSSR